jgi:hypothetical protein
VQCMGRIFGLPSLKSPRPLHKNIRVERVEGIPQLERKTENRFCISWPSNSSNIHTTTDRYIHLCSFTAATMSFIQTPRGEMKTDLNLKTVFENAVKVER